MGDKKQEEIPDFFSFAPNDNIDGNEEAYNALSFALDLNNKKIHNIAISGPFGAGKSSLWRSYRKNKLPKNKVAKFLNKIKLRWKQEYPSIGEILDISLAKFEEEKNKGCDLNNDSVDSSNFYIEHVSDEKNDKLKIKKEHRNDDIEKDQEKVELEIEKAILQQMLFSEECEKIPCLDSYKISTSKVKYTFMLVACISFVILFLVGIGFPIDFEFIKKFWQINTEIDGEKLYGNIIYIGAVGIIFICSVFYLFNFLTKAINIHICGFSFKGLDVSFDSSKGSLINQNYSAIVYFFEKTKKKIVVFEDLDRFSSNRIFVKLRELNTILNNCPKLKNKIKFVYMVKENLFTRYERTKFFEMIIPVLPVVNMEACADYLLSEKKRINRKLERKKIFEKWINRFPKKKICKGKCLKRKIEKSIARINNEIKLSPIYLITKIEDNLLQIVGNYINDFRIVSDCLNEFKIYKNQIKRDFKKNEAAEEAIDDKIFAMIVYKNYYPQDFEDLHRHRGFLYEICKNYKYGKIEIENGDECEKLDFDYPINENLRDASSNRYKDNGRWIFRQCLKLELKFKYNDNNEDKLNLLAKTEKYGRSSLLFELIQNGYIDINCEFYVSRKYFGDLTMNDCRYFIIVQSNSNPDFELSIEKPRLLENKILDDQWSSISALNKKMFAYELSSYDEIDANKNKRVKGLISAMCEAEKMNKGFFNQFIKYLDNEIKDYDIELKDEVFTINKSVRVLPGIKNLLWDAIYANMDDDTIKTLFGE